MCGAMPHMEPLHHCPSHPYWSVAPRRVSLWEPSYKRLARMAQASPTYVISTSAYAPTDACGTKDEAQMQDDKGETKNAPQAADPTTATSTEDAQSTAKDADTCATALRSPVSKRQRLLSPMALYDPAGYFSLGPLVNEVFGDLDRILSADNDRASNFLRVNARSRFTEHEKNYSLEVEVPGFAKDEVQLHWDDASQSLQIKGESRQSPVSPESTSTAAENPIAASAESAKPETEEVSKAAMDVEEDSHESAKQPASSQTPTETRYHRQFERSFKFAQPVNPEGITAKLENGLLSIAVPKATKSYRPIPIDA
ncbi:hypothetical protein IWQ62_003182 [Dispira parvispora]|uniref:SHSP domain-containing protein n=1 Tax=Dispira parvispora TaxID=1520584 RepID=A0A9W8ARC5_9FUNG|nr:hypothetical protein IWQ62_003182 [Dispira parvispora]